MGFISFGMLVFWVQGSSPCYAQSAVTNFSTTSPVNAPPTNVSSTNSLLFASSQVNSSTATVTSTNSDASSGDKTPPTLTDAAKLYNQDKLDEALAMVNAVLQSNPKNSNAYILRGAINSAKQLWDQAEKDYQTALQMEPTNDGIRYDLADLRFKQKQFDDARRAFVSLPNNPDEDIRDLIKYKIFLCDLLEGHDDIAAKELDAFNQAGINPSYYFGNAAWDLVHKKPEEARSWLVSATRIYPPRKHLLYLSMLKNMGYLPLPPATDSK